MNNPYRRRSLTGAYANRDNRREPCTCLRDALVRETNIQATPLKLSKTNDAMTAVDRRNRVRTHAAYKELAACAEERCLTEELLERERRDNKLTGDEGWTFAGERDQMRRDVHLRLDMRETNLRSSLELVDR